ncbi:MULTISPECIES: hypothetical protein [unclassified Pseudomonas]|uniref:hypothetical protein n=1 Tax=unclassified Pseudomonas TaxID=196821 RepID=UPI000D88219E|nr:MULTISPECIES: hypothetical protein [unclassified Pseudomonas]PYG78385.1 hypothetical protein N428_02802 [Pseudomonas sp. RV120224-01c]PYG82674.1 hypothetical protein N436_02668 [Pseudomonas sp. RV120224-01b]
MELIDLFALIACVLLVVSGLGYGVAFIRRKNYLLGVEFLIVGISATNFTTFIATGWQANYNVAIFLDAFSRGVGVPVIAMLGLMAVTHNYKPSPAKDVILFLAAFVATAFYYLSTGFKEWLPYFYILTWSFYTLFLVYFIWRLVRAGESLHALATLLGGVAGLTIALRYDFFPIPGDDTKMIFMTCAFLTWSYSIVQLFYAYGALQRSRKVSSHAVLNPS